MDKNRNENKDKSQYKIYVKKKSQILDNNDFNFHKNKFFIPIFIFSYIY